GYARIPVAESPPGEVHPRVERPDAAERIRGDETGRRPRMAAGIVPSVAFEAAGYHEPVGRRVEIAGRNAELPPPAFRFGGSRVLRSVCGRRRFRYGFFLRKRFENEFRFLCFETGTCQYG